MNAPPPFRCLRFRLYYTFSRHFNTCPANVESTFGKEALAAEAALSGLQRSNATLTETLRDQAGSNHSALWSFIEDYLSSAHRENRADGCTIASLASDAARQEKQVQASFAKGIDEELDILASYFAKTPAEDQEDLPASARERAVQLLSELVGAIILARAVAQANRPLSDEILEAVSTGLQTQMKQTTPMNE